MSVVAERTIDLRACLRLDAVVVRPGDTLIIRPRTSMNMAELDHLQGLIGEYLPATRVLVIDNAEQLLVYRPDGDGDE